jgi:hypothetical protein
MTPEQVTVAGTLKQDGSLELDEKPNLPPGRVCITIQPAQASSVPPAGWWEVLQQIWKEQAASGFRGRTKEEIDADLDALREEWEERMRELEAIHEAARRSREQTEC